MLVLENQGGKWRITEKTIFIGILSSRLNAVTKGKGINSEIISYFELILIILIIQILLIRQVKRIFQIYILSEYFYNILFLTRAKKFVFLTTLQCKEKGSVALQYLPPLVTALMSFFILLSRGQLSLHFQIYSLGKFRQHVADEILLFLHINEAGYIISPPTPLLMLYIKGLCSEVNYSILDCTSNRHCNCKWVLL